MKNYFDPNNILNEEQWRLVKSCSAVIVWRLERSDPGVVEAPGPQLVCIRDGPTTAAKPQQHCWENQQLEIKNTYISQFAYVLIAVVIWAMAKSKSKSKSVCICLVLLTVLLSIYPSFRMSICLSVSLSIWVVIFSVYLSVSHSVYTFIHPSLCLSF